MTSEISLLEGTLQIRGKDDEAGEPLILESGMSTTIVENMPPEAPAPIKDSQLKELLNCTTLSQ